MALRRTEEIMVKTAADEHRDKAMENINDAIANIAAIVVEQAWGWDEYNKDYLRELRRGLNRLLDIRTSLQH